MGGRIDAPIPTLQEKLSIRFLVALFAASRQTLCRRVGLEPTSPIGKGIASRSCKGWSPTGTYESLAQEHRPPGEGTSGGMLLYETSRDEPIMNSLYFLEPGV